MNRNCILVGVTVAFRVHLQGQSIQVTFSETEFALTDWSLQVAQWGGGGSASATQALESSNHYRVVEHVVNDPVPDAYTQMAAFHFSPGFTWVPARMGGIESMDYSVDFVTPVTAVGLGLALRQGSNVVWGGGYQAAHGTDGDEWVTQTATNLTADSFPAGIDFSEAGAPIEIGLITANSTTWDSTGYQTSIWLDNFSVTVVPAPPRLQAGWSALGLVLSWPGSMTNYVLQSSAHLGTNAFWHNVSDSMLIGGKQVVHVEMTNAFEFYRLKSP